MKSAYEVLKKAKSMIDAPEKWCKEDFKMDLGTGNRYCAYGAINFSGADIKFIKAATRILREALKGINTNIISFNDSINTEHKDVMEMYNKAIGIAKKRLKKS